MHYSNNSTLTLSFTVADEPWWKHVCFGGQNFEAVGYVFEWIVMTEAEVCWKELGLSKRALFIGAWGGVVVIVSGTAVKVAWFTFRIVNALNHCGYFSVKTCDITQLNFRAAIT
jgi:hypothetical protein